MRPLRGAGGISGLTVLWLKACCAENGKGRPWGGSLQQEGDTAAQQWGREQKGRLNLCEDSCQCGLVYWEGGHWTEGGALDRNPQCACLRTVQVMSMFTTHTLQTGWRRTGNDGSLRGAVTLGPSRSGSDRRAKCQEWCLKVRIKMRPHLCFAVKTLRDTGRVSGTILNQKPLPIPNSLKPRALWDYLAVPGTTWVPLPHCTAP